MFSLISTNLGNIQYLQPEFVLGSNRISPESAFSMICLKQKIILIRGASSGIPSSNFGRKSTHDNNQRSCGSKSTFSRIPSSGSKTIYCSNRNLLAVSLPTAATNEVAEISLRPVASLLPAVSLPTVATDQMVASISLLSTASTAAISTPVVVANLQSATIATTSGSAGARFNGGPRLLAVSGSSVYNCITETRVDNHIDDDHDKVPSMVLPYRAVAARLIPQNQTEAAESPYRALGRPLMIVIRGPTTTEIHRLKMARMGRNSSLEIAEMTIDISKIASLIKIVRSIQMMVDEIEVATNLRKIPITTIDSSTTTIRLILNINTVGDIINPKEIKAIGI